MILLVSQVMYSDSTKLNTRILEKTISAKLHPVILHLFFMKETQISLILSMVYGLHLYVIYIFLKYPINWVTFTVIIHVS